MRTSVGKKMGILKFVSVTSDYICIGVDVSEAAYISSLSVWKSLSNWTMISIHNKNPKLPWATTYKSKNNVDV